MNLTIAHFWNMKKYITSITSKNIKIWPYFPINFSPRNSIGLSNECDKFFEIPRFIYNMFSSNLPIAVNIRFTLTAMHYFSLTHCKKLVTISTFI
jgi:hypothetical protein